jgi:chemotaxis protein methyltransferase CheR
MTSVNVPLLRDLLERHSGLDLGRGGMEVNLLRYVERRLATRDLSFERYWEQLEIPGSEELRLLVETMTVIYTWFFRDPGQFEVIEQLIRSFSAERSMGIWVAGCATGEEPYSVALVANNLAKRVDILATDLNSSALHHAKVGRYTSTSLDAVDATLRRRFLGSSSKDFVVPDAVKQSVRFQVGNLVEAAPRAQAPEGWDLVICRNVLIYFGQDQARRTLDKLASSLAPGGALVLGASEAILERPSSLDVVGMCGRSVLMRPRLGECRPSRPRLPSAEVRSSEPRLKDAPSSVFALPSPVSACAGVGRIELETAVGQRRAENPATENRLTIVSSSTSTAATATARSAIDLGHVSLDAGNIPKARDHYLQAVRLDPTSAEALMFAGIAHYLDGAFTEALHYLRGALCLDASLWAACFYQALCYENMGYAEDAAHSFAQVVRLADRPTRRENEHAFLKGWRDDLLGVAVKRANQYRTGHSSSRMRIRVRNGSR